MLTRNSVRATLRRAVAMAKESDEEDAALERCWTLAREPWVQTIQAAQTNTRIDCRRLHQNLAGLIATAGAGAAANGFPGFPEGEAPARVRQWLRRAACCLSGQWEHADEAVQPSEAGHSNQLRI